MTPLCAFQLEIGGDEITEGRERAVFGNNASCIKEGDNEELTGHSYLGVWSVGQGATNGTGLNPSDSDSFDRLGSYTANTSPTSSVVYGYDLYSRVLSINIASGLRQGAYTWYKNGNLKTDGGETHYYDKIGRLTSTTGNSQWGPLSWSYDEAGNRRTSNDAGCDVTYTYPGNDNGQQTLTAQPGCIPGVTLAVTWTHDNNGRTTQGAETQNGAPTNTYYWTYDSAGRLTQDKKYSYATQTYTVRGDYWYGPDGELLKSTEGTTTEYRFPYGQQVVYSWNSASESRDYVFGDGLLLSERKVVSGSPTPYFVFQDGGGHVRLILDNSKAVVWEAMYKPYGNQVVLTPSLPNVFRWVGSEQRDAIGGLEYMHARWYNPLMGQFYTREPIEGAGAHTMRPNLYGYALDNPKTFSDKSGLAPTTLPPCVALCDWWDKPPQRPSAEHMGGDDCDLECMAYLVGSLLYSPIGPSPMAPAKAIPVALEGAEAATKEAPSLGARLLKFLGLGAKSEGAKPVVNPLKARGAGAGGGVTGSPYTKAGTLTDEALANSKEIIEGRKLGNPRVIDALTADGGSIENWGKYTTLRSYDSPAGPFQPHFYRNRVTGGVSYEVEYKSVLRPDWWFNRGGV